MENPRGNDTTVKKNNKFNTFLPNTYVNLAYIFPNISINKDGIIVYTNEDLSRILGYQKKTFWEWMQKRSTSILPIGRIY